MQLQTANLTVLRGKHDKHYKVIDLTCLEDPRLGMKAKCIIYYLVTRPNGWTVYMKQLATVSRDGLKAVYSALQEAYAYGYVYRVYKYVKGSREKKWGFIVHEKPCSPEETEQYLTDGWMIYKHKYVQGGIPYNGVGGVYPKTEGRVSPETGNYNKDSSIVDESTSYSQEGESSSEDAEASSSHRNGSWQGKKASTRKVVIPPDLQTYFDYWIELDLPLGNRTDAVNKLKQLFRSDGRRTYLLAENQSYVQYLDKIWTEEDIKYAMDNYKQSSEKLKAKTTLGKFLYNRFLKLSLLVWYFENLPPVKELLPDEYPKMTQALVDFFLMDVRRGHVEKVSIFHQNKFIQQTQRLHDYYTKKLGCFSERIVCFEDLVNCYLESLRWYADKCTGDLGNVEKWVIGHIVNEGKIDGVLVPYLQKERYLRADTFERDQAHAPTPTHKRRRFNSQQELEEWEEQHANDPEMKEEREFWDEKIQDWVKVEGAHR